uniref:Uncharacterized protein n=1 Tax=Trichobilharzia regenti TaxID=157069 RepID=A0AA85J917_TRIRE|nr:unnamed protein product [Trichobilharzia regenti]
MATDNDILDIIKAIKRDENDTSVEFPFERISRLLLDEKGLPDALVECIVSAAFDPSLIRLKGFELLFPGLWKCAFLRASEVNWRSSQVFPVLNQIVRFNSFVDFADQFASILVTSVEKASKLYMFDADCISFLDALLQFGMKHNVDLNDALLKSVIICGNEFDSSCKDDSLWNRLILIIKLINLMKSVDVTNNLLESLKQPISFCLDCLKTKRFSSMSKQFCLVLQFLAALTTLYQSLKWLEDFCCKSNNGEPFILIVTTVIIELRLYLAYRRSPNRYKSIYKQQSFVELSTRSSTVHRFPTDIMVDVHPLIIKRNISEACAVIFQYSLKEIEKGNNTVDTVDNCDNSSDIASTGCLIAYASNETVKNMWLQCVDAGEDLLDFLLAYRAIVKRDYNCDIRFLWDDKAKPNISIDALLIEVYFSWLAVYFTTRCMQCENASETASAFERLFNKYLAPISLILTSLTTHHFKKYSMLSDPKNHSSDDLKWIQSVANICSVINQLYTITSNPKFFTGWFPWDSVDKPFCGEMVCNWLKKIWNVDFLSTQICSSSPVIEVLTNILELINSCILDSQIVKSTENIKQRDLFTWLAEPGELFHLFTGSWISFYDVVVNQPSLCIEYICTVVKLWIIYQKWSKEFSPVLNDTVKKSLFNIPDDLFIGKILYLSSSALSNSSVFYHLRHLSQVFKEATEYDDRFVNAACVVENYMFVFDL